MDLVVIGSIGLVIVISIIAILIVISFKKKVSQHKGEVKLYKSANEYQTDAMAVFSEKEEVLFSNKAGRKLLDLEIHYENQVIPHEILVQSGNNEPQNIFEFIQKQENITQGMIYLEKIILLIDEKKHRINLYIDHSKWNMENSIICVFQDANSDFREKENMKKLAETDFLTGLPSQFRASLDINNLAVEAQKRSERFALCLFDINNFKQMRVALGHAYANTLLKKFAQFLEKIKHKDMYAYRLGCNNFILVIDNFKREKVLLETIEEISSEISRLFSLEYEDVHIVSSLGVVLFPEHGKNANKLIDRAYMALDNANEKGSGSISMYEESHQKDQADEIKLSQEIRLGLQNKEFSILYEPIYTIETNIVSGANIVLQWNHPRLGIIGKDKFLDVAETTGQSIDIDNFIIDEVVRQRKLWNNFNFKNIHLFMAISPSQLHLESFIPDLASLFEENGIDPQDFIFDVSSSVAKDGVKGCHNQFMKLKKMGIALAIENLDIGASTMEELNKHMIHTLKVNSSLLKSDQGQEVLKSIISLAHALDIEVFAENIKSKKEASIIHKFECDKAQGEHYSKPLAPFELQEFLR